jgi:hypothetical protein
MPSNWEPWEKFKKNVLIGSICINFIVALVCFLIYLFNENKYGSKFYVELDITGNSANHPLSFIPFLFVGILLYILFYWRADKILEWRFWNGYLFSMLMFTLLPLWLIINLIIN